MIWSARSRLMACLLALGASIAAAAPAVMELELPALDGTRFVRLTDFAGQPVLLNFWASDCPSCVKEMPVLNAMAGTAAAPRFLGIAVDERQKARNFLATQGASYPQLLAPTSAAALLRRFGNRAGGLPYTVVLDARHMLCATRLGEVDAGWIASAISACRGTPSRAASADFRGALE